MPLLPYNEILFTIKNVLGSAFETVDISSASSQSRIYNIFTMILLTISKKKTSVLVKINSNSPYLNYFVHSK